MSEATSVRSEILDSPPFNIGTRQALTAGIAQRQTPVRPRAILGSRFGDLYGASPIMQQLFMLLGKVAPSQAMILIQGESGTGKELAATTVHKMSTLSDQPFVAVNCGAFPPSLVEAELFGHERGGFTGAVRSRKGCFERASGGTLFLDEVTEMPPDRQVKLLPGLETGRLCGRGGRRASGGRTPGGRASSRRGGSAAEGGRRPRPDRRGSGRGAPPRRAPR